MEAGPYGARRIVEGYAFPDSDKAKIILPPPTKDLILKYFRGGQKEQFLRDQITKHSASVSGETQHQKSRRVQVANAARHLLNLGSKFTFTNLVHKPYATVINGLRVKASYDFVARTVVGKREQLICVIVNVAHEISDNADRLSHHAKVESEIAFEVLRNHLPVEAVWYIDLPSEKLARPPMKKSLVTVWRDVETACDDILLKYNSIVAKRARPRQ